MIPSLNLQKLRSCAPAPVLNTTTTPRGNSAIHSTSVHDTSVGSAQSTERSSCAGGDHHEVSAIRSGAVDAALFLRCDVDNETDISVLRSKLREAKSLLVALDAWYAARLAEKEQLMVYRLGQLTNALESPRAGGRATAGTVSSNRRSSVAPATPRRQSETEIASGQRRPVSPRLYPGTGTPTSERRRGVSPSVGRAPSEVPPSESGSSVAGSRRYSTNGTRSPSSAVHPRPFGSNAGRRNSSAAVTGVPYVPATASTIGYSPRAPLSGSFGTSRLASTPGTPMGTPRPGCSRPGTTGHSPLDMHTHQLQSFGVSPRQTAFTTPLSARSTGGAPVSARRSQIQTVNWSSSIPHSSTSAGGEHASGGGVVLRGASTASSPVVATARGPAASASAQINRDTERRAQTPRY